MRLWSLVPFFKAVCYILSKNLGAVVAAGREPVAAEGNSVLLCLSKSLENYRPRSSSASLASSGSHWHVTAETQSPLFCWACPTAPTQWGAAHTTSRVYKASLLISPVGFSPGTVTAYKSPIIPQFFLTLFVGFLKNPSSPHPTMVYK